MEKITNEKPRRITHTVSGNKSRHYYFFPEPNRGKAKIAAHTYKSTYPQCFEKWIHHKKVERPGVITVEGQKFKAPSPGWVMVFESSSPS